MFGVGGGLIIVPVLHFVLLARGYPADHLMHMAVATSLAVIVITSISSTLAHQRKQAVIWRSAILIAPGVVIGAWIGGLFASSLGSSALSYTFATFELLVAISLIMDIRSDVHYERLPAPVASLAGSIIGFVSTIVGIGGGTMTVPFLHWFGASMRNAVATSAAIGFPIALVGVLSYIYTGWGFTATDSQGNTALTLGYIDLTAFAIIASSSFLFAPVGAKLAHSLPERALRNSFALLLFSLSLMMFTQ